MGDTDLSLAVLSTSAPRGGTFTVKVTGDRSSYRSVRVELVLLEHKVSKQFGPGHDHPIVVNSVTVPDGQDIVEVTVPWHVPCAYAGETIGWDYELRVVGDKLGRDHRDGMVVTISPEVQAKPQGGGVTLLSSRATQLDRVGAPKHKSLVSTALWSAVIGAVSLVVGVAGNKIVFTVGGVVILLFAAFSGWQTWRYSHTNLDEVSFEVQNVQARLGESIGVTVMDTSSRSLEVGLMMIEYFIVKGKNTSTATDTKVYEHWMPVVGRQIQLQIPADRPSGYPGTEIAVHWMVGLREAGLPASRQLFTQRVIPVGITH